MDKRPALNKNLEEKTFRNYYYLKEELINFCKENRLPTSGNKMEITDRIAYFLKTGEVMSSDKVKPKTKSNIETITEYIKIEPDFVCSEKHREFFKDKIGKNFTFNVAFQKWLKNNTGKTYGEAIEAYYKILDEKKKSKTVIDKQFEYNTYIRDFFSDNNGKTLAEAISCWKYKKSLKGHNRYEKSDLCVLGGKI